MTPGLALILLALGGFFAAQFAFDRLARRFAVVSGAEYVLAGVFLGPHVANVLSPSMLESLAAFPVLALGWMGATIGAQLFVPRLLERPAAAYRVAATESVITLVFVGALQLIALPALYDVPMLAAAPAAITLGALAVSASRHAFEVTALHLRDDHPLALQLDVSTTINGLFAVVTFGLMLAAFHPDPPGAVRPLTTTEWAVVTAALGIVGGGLFHLFVAGEHQVDRLFVALAGAIILVSGAAAYLQLSPLMAATFFGAMLINTSRSRDEIRAALARVQRPLYFVLLVYAGASWTPGSGLWALPVLLFIAARAAAKIGAARLAARQAGMLGALGSDWGAALIGHGAVAIALAIDYARQSDLAFANVVFTAAIASVVLTEFTSARTTRALARKSAIESG